MRASISRSHAFSCYVLPRCRTERLRLVRCGAGAAASPTGGPAVAAPPAPAPARPLLYDGIALDMDGTLTSCVIDFQDMRKRTGIPVGDLFVAMESWEEPDAIKASMDVILEIEEAASRNIAAKDGLLQLLQLLRDSQVKVALVTRNTTQSVDAFFGLVGEEWRSLFSEIRTREFLYVKPDKRLLLELAQTWRIHPGKLLMVGDSHEDVECGNAAGTATCLIAGGGNEVAGAAAAGPPPGAVPTFCVRNLPELTQRLLDSAPPSSSSPSPSPSAANTTTTTSSVSSSGDVAEALASIDGLDASSVALLGHSLRSVASMDGSLDSLDDGGSGEGLGLALPLDPSLLNPSSPGVPAAGLDFVDALVELGALHIASTSFPRMGAAAGGLAACSQGGGDSVVHVGCGDGALTKMLASKGLRVWAADVDVAAATKRGLRALAYAGPPLADGSLTPVKAAAGGAGVDAVLIYTPPQLAGGIGSDGGALSSSSSFSQGALAELGRLLVRGGRLCVEVPLAASVDTAAEEARLRAALQAAGYSSISSLQMLPGWLQKRVRVVAAWAGGAGGGAEA